MELTNVSKLFVGFVALIIGIVLITSIATSTLAVTDKKIIYDEHFDLVTLGCSNESAFNNTNALCNLTVANAPTAGTWKEDDCPIASLVVENTSAGTYTALTEGTDYLLFASAGIIDMQNTTATQIYVNDTYVSYSYCGDDYLNQAWSRTVLNLLAGFFALAIMGVGIGLFYSVYKSAGIGA